MQLQRDPYKLPAFLKTGAAPAQKNDEANHTLNIRHEQSHGPQPLIDCVNRMHVEANKPNHFHWNKPVGFSSHHYRIHDANRRAPYNYMGQNPI